MADVTIVNYGLGNIRAFKNVFDALNVSCDIASTATEMGSARRLILPGVGAFDWAMAQLNASGMREALDDLVLAKSVPVLGVCVGMQMMADSSEEGVLPGLGWISGTVRRMTGEGQGLPLPHMGWNDVKPVSSDGLFLGLTEPTYYFLHSYCFDASDASTVAAVTDYGLTFASSVRRSNIYGTQFHPEKSHHWGVGLLKNFAEA